MSLTLDALCLDAQTRLLVVAPHPDDESIATGELLQHVGAAGGTAQILLLTDGDNNPWPQRWLERRLSIGEAERRRWGQRRRTEVGQALRRLGLSPQALHAQGLPDLGLTGRLCGDMAGMLDLLGARLDDYRPNLIAFPALADHHPDHSAAHVMTRLAVARWRDGSPRLLSYLVHGHATDTGAAIALPASAELHTNKLTALGEHLSQMALSGGRMRRLADRPERYREAGGAAPAGDGLLPWRPAAALRPWLHLTLVDGDGVRSWSWSQAPLARRDGGQVALTLPPPAAGGPRFVKMHMNLPSPWIFDRWGWCEL
jgi:LmbE family N-acetylglucosaminyl deacetylase